MGQKKIKICPLESTIIVDFKNVSHDHVMLEVFCQTEEIVDGPSAPSQIFRDPGGGRVVNPRHVSPFTR